MGYLDLLFPGGRNPTCISDWIVLIVSAFFAAFMCVFLLLLGLTALAGTAALLEQIMTWTVVMY